MERDFLVDGLRTYFAGKPEVVFGYLFGSYAKNKAKGDSDLDIGIYINDYHLDLFYNYKLDETERLQRFSVKRLILF